MYKIYNAAVSIVDRPSTITELMSSDYKYKLEALLIAADQAARVPDKADVSAELALLISTFDDGSVYTPPAVTADITETVARLVYPCDLATYATTINAVADNPSVALYETWIAALKDLPNSEEFIEGLQRNSDNLERVQILESLRGECTVALRKYLINRFLAIEKRHRTMPWIQLWLLNSLGSKYSVHMHAFTDDVTDDMDYFGVATE